ncbi:hypothetical protein GGI17_000528 [Coemansia sp. S146]|nr:hypothetical protein GGI17_000528 [Coemansia sp. S146]
MTLQPQFQSLPIVVTEKIIEYLEGRLRNSLGDDIKQHNQKKKILYPLLSVSEARCEAAFVSICDDCEVIFNDAYRVFDVTYPAWPADFLYPGFHKTRLGDYRLVAVQRCDFPLATKLVVELNKFKPARFSMYANPINHARTFDSAPKR